MAFLASLFSSSIVKWVAIGVVAALLAGAVYKVWDAIDSAARLEVALEQQKMTTDALHSALETAAEQAAQNAQDLKRLTQAQRESARAVASLRQSLSDLRLDDLIETNPQEAARALNEGLAGLLDQLEAVGRFDDPIPLPAE